MVSVSLKWPDGVRFWYSKMWMNLIIYLAEPFYQLIYSIVYTETYFPFFPFFLLYLYYLM